MHEFEIFLESEEATIGFGRNLAAATFSDKFTAGRLPNPPENEGFKTMGAVIYLTGGLGAGKTTLTRGVMRGYGYNGAVKSPTYTIVEPYEFDRCNIYHFDLYRLNDLEEVAYLGVEDYFAPGNICVFEWAENGGKSIPEADVVINLVDKGSGRLLRCRNLTKKGSEIVARLCK
jgi:tRNA threonylcarbamoyladenosine biosynthesis protein TsaE